MLPEELTIEFAENLFEKSGLIPRSGEYCVDRCGCLVGAMYFSDHITKTSLDHDSSEIESLVTKYAMEEYEIGLSAIVDIVTGFDAGYDRFNSHFSKKNKERSPWYAQAYNIGEHFSPFSSDLEEQ